MDILVGIELKAKGTSFTRRICFRNPDTSKVKQKMVYASSLDALSKKLDFAKFISHSDFSELNEDVLTQNVMDQDKV